MQIYTAILNYQFKNFQFGKLKLILLALPDEQIIIAI